MKQDDIIVWVMNRKEYIEILKKHYQYRERLLKGEIKLPYKAATRLIGPDRAYHLYRFVKPTRGK